MTVDLTEGAITKKMMLFSLPLMAGNILQQLYNVADTLIVGRFIGTDALAAVGSAYTLMTFLTSIILGLCMGSGALFSIRYGEGNLEKLKESMVVSFVLIGFLTVVLNVAVFLGIDLILHFLRVPGEICGMMKEYLVVIFAGIIATFLYNYFACLLRAVGESVTPLLFLAVSAVLNIVLDLWFVLGLGTGVSGAALATVISQYVSGVGIAIYTWWKKKEFRVQTRHMRIRWGLGREIFGFSFLTSVQQSIMNLGILMVQGLVNSFGAGVMAAFAAAVKIDSFAYMPVQDFGNAFSTFVAQNYGADKPERIRIGCRRAAAIVVVFCIVISALVFLFSRPLLTLFIEPGEKEILSIGVQYLRIEGTFYLGIGFLFLFYGYYRAVRKPGMSVVLTVISLGTRVVLAYVLSATAIGVTGIWWSVPIGWALADLAGWVYYKRMEKRRGLCRDSRRDCLRNSTGAFDRLHYPHRNSAEKKF